MRNHTEAEPAAPPAKQGSAGSCSPSLLGPRASLTFDDDDEHLSESMNLEQLVTRLAIATALVAGWALRDSASPVSVAVLVALVLAWLRLLIVPLRRKGVPNALTLASSLIAGSILAFAFSDYTSFLPTFQSILGLSVISVILLVLPVLFLFVAEFAVPYCEGQWAPILVPAWAFAFAGYLQSLVGVGRTFWWINGVGDSTSWWRAYGGSGLEDFLWAGLAASCVEVVMAQDGAFDFLERYEAPLDGHAARYHRGGSSQYVEDQSTRDDVDPEGALEPRRPTSPASRFRPLLIFVVLLGIGPILPSRTYHPLHPSPISSTFVYPPLKVACVVPPSLVASEGKGEGGTLEEWIHETKVAAGKGAKVLSWSEGAVRLEPSRRGKGEGWEGMAQNEKELLMDVSEVATLHKVYIAATYLVPALPPASSHHLLNVVTLVGPSSPTSDPELPPNIIFSTTKHIPVPFVETYSHASRNDRILGSSSHALPLSTLTLEHHVKTPAPHLTPFQNLSVSAALCLDIFSPSLLNTYIAPSSIHLSKHTPELILNPSHTPGMALAEGQYDQMRSRAIEQRAWILRCDGPDGVSGLVSPHGEVRDFKRGDEHGGSWDAELDLERARGKTLFSSLGQEVVLMLLAVGVMVVLFGTYTIMSFPAIQPGASLIVAYQLTNQPVLVVGGGEVAAGRLSALLNAGAKVTLITPSQGLSPEVRFRIHDDPLAKASIIYKDRTYAGEEDLEGMKMVLTAIDEEGLSEEIAQACRRRNIPVNVADVPPSCDFYFGSIVRRGPLQIMVSTGGKGPRIANRVRRMVEETLPDSVGDAILNVGELRKGLRKIAPGGGKEIPRRMGWMVDVCDKWSLEQLAEMDDEMREEILEGYARGEAKSWATVKGGWRAFVEKWVPGGGRVFVNKEPAARDSHALLVGGTGFLLGALTVGAVVVGKSWVRR